VRSSIYRPNDKKTNAYKYGIYRYHALMYRHEFVEGTIFLFTEISIMSLFHYQQNKKNNV